MTIIAPEVRTAFPITSWRRLPSRIGASLTADPAGDHDGNHEGGGLSINMSTAGAVDHVPTLPSWNCRGCHTAWPCADARTQLRAQYTHDPGQLSALLGTYVHRAAGDLPTLSPQELFTRFLAWDRPPNHPPPHDSTE